MKLTRPDILLVQNAELSIMNIEELIKYIFNNEIIIGTIVVVVILIKIIFLVALVFGLTYLIHWWFRRSTKIKKTFVQTTGEIVGYSPSYSNSRKKMYRPRIGFIDHHQNSILFDDDRSSSFKPKIGKTVKVLYNPECSYDAVVDSFSSRYLLFIMSAIMLVFVLLHLGTEISDIIMFLLTGNYSTS